MHRDKCLSNFTILALVQAADQAETDSKGTSARKDFSVATKMQKPWIFS